MRSVQHLGRYDLTALYKSIIIIIIIDVSVPLSNYSLHLPIYLVVCKLIQYRRMCPRRSSRIRALLQYRLHART